MRTFIITFFLIAALGACGDKKNATETSQTELSASEETQLADSISNAYQDAQSEISRSTEETLQEVDSLLDNI